MDVKDLGFYLENSLKLDKQINTIVSTSFYHICWLAKVKPFLCRKSFETVIHVFISTRLDYVRQVTSLLHLPPPNGPKQDHITPILSTLHWLPVRYRIDFKVLLFVYKAHNNLAPKYLSDLIVTYNPSRSLRS